MLQGYVHILAHISLLSHHLKQFHRELVGVSIVQPYPLHTLDVCHLPYQVGYPSLAVEVYAVIGQLLGYYLKLLRALAHQLSHLVEYLLYGSAHVLSRYQRNGAIGTVAVTTF